MTLTYFIIIPILVGVLVYILPKINYYLVVLALEIPLLILAFNLLLRLNNENEISNVLGARSEILGIELIATKFNIIFVILALILFLCGILYSLKDSYMDKKFMMLFYILQGLVCGIFLSDDLFNIYVLLEVATVIVAILIIFKRDSFAIYDGLIYLFSQIVCMVFYLFGVGYMYKIFGVLSISKIDELMRVSGSKELILPFSFIMTALCLKSALFPLFSWLPRAHGTPSAPSSVSAILSGIYVKNGIYLLIVFTRLFYPLIDLSEFFMVIGIITSVLGFTFAIAQTDIKLILAFHTISQMGLIVFGFSLPSEVSKAGAMYHIINHALFKSLLFLSAGAVISKYGTRDIKKISGVLKTMPLIGVSALVGALGITGAPFFNGSISKYFIQYGVKDSFFEIILLIINMGTVISFVKFTRILWGDAPIKVTGIALKQGVTLSLSLLCILGGIFGTEFINFWLDLELYVNPISYLEKAITYFIMVILGHFIYKYFLSKNHTIYKLQRVSLNFLQIVVCMTLFFMSIAITSAVKYIL